MRHEGPLRDAGPLTQSRSATHVRMVRVLNDHNLREKENKRISLRPSKAVNRLPGALGAKIFHEIKCKCNKIKFNRRLHGNMQQIQRQQHLLQF